MLRSRAVVRVLWTARQQQQQVFARASTWTHKKHPSCALPNCRKLVTDATGATGGTPTVDDSFVVTRPRPSREGEDVEKRRARLLYQSRKRGIKENDLLMGSFAAEHLHEFSPQELDEYDMIINEHDNEWDMYAWMVGSKSLPEYLQQSSVMMRLVEFAKNKKKELRIELPPLY